MLKDFGGVLHHIFFCHGVINFMGGLEANLQEYKYWHVEHDRRTHTGDYVDKSAEYGKVSKINVRATMHVMSICIPFMRWTAHKTKQEGTITVLSASAGEYPWPGHTIFNVNMAALNMMVRCAALENGIFNIRVNAVAPGYVRNLNPKNARTNTDFDQCLDKNEPTQNNVILSNAADSTPLVQTFTHDDKKEYVRQIQEPEEVAAEMLWLGSYSANFINGQVTVMDSGIG